MSAKVIYRDIALGAAEEANVSSSVPLENFCDISTVTNVRELPGIATCELNGWGLTRDYTARGETLAFWSKEKSGADCLFASALSLSVSFPQAYSSTGLTIRFSPETMDYCKQCRVEWYRGEELEDSGDYIVDNPDFVIDKLVRGYDKLVFTFQETNLPGRRCKIEQITIGVIRVFNADELRSVSAINEVDLISATVPINVLDVSLYSKKNIDYVFMRKQPVEAYDGDKLIGVYYIEKGKRTGGSDYSVSCQDIVGILDLVTYGGGIWLEDTPLRDILAAVFGSLVEFEIDPAFENATLRGFIEPEKTMREALMQIAFALGAVVDTSGTNKIKIFPVPTETEAIQPRNTYGGGNVETSDKVTEVTVTAYRFFDERPSGEDEFVELDGVQYRYYTETKHALNPDVIANDPENKVKFIGYYLCNLDNSQERADAIMEYYRRRNKYSFSHVLTNEEPAGSRSVYLPWYQKKSGNITKMTISMSGLTVCNSEMLLND